jgi:rod shape-determining protein MreD
MFGALVCAAVLQSLNRDLGLAGGRPDLVLLLVLSWGLLRGMQEGGFAGLVGGLFLDMFSIVPFGTSAVLLGLLGLLAGLGEGSFTRGRLALLASTAILATVAFHGGAYLALQAMGWALPSAAAFLSIVAPTAILNVVLVPLVYRFTLLVQGPPVRGRQLEL